MNRLDEPFLVRCREEAPPLLYQFVLYLLFVLKHPASTATEYYLDLRIFLRFILQDRAMVEKGTSFDEIPIRNFSRDALTEIGEEDITRFIFFLSLPVNESGRGLSTATVLRKLMSVRKFFDFLVYRKICLSNPCQNVSLPKCGRKAEDCLSSTEANCLSPPEVTRLLQAISGPNRARDCSIIHLILTCGLRVSEIVRMDLGDIRQPVIQIHGSGLKEREVCMDRSCQDSLDLYLALREEKYAPRKEAVDAVFLTRHHTRISPDTVQHLVNQALLQAGLDATHFSPHKLRFMASTLCSSADTNGLWSETADSSLWTAASHTNSTHTAANV